MKTTATFLSAFTLMIVAACANAPTTDYKLRDNSQDQTIPVYDIQNDQMARLTTLPYQPDQNVDAHHCEFYVDGFGLGQWSRHSSHRAWIDSYIFTAGDIGTVINVGTYVKLLGLNDFSANGHGLYLAKKIDDNKYESIVNYEYNQHAASVIPIRQRIEQIAYFVDVKRTNGSIDRLWYKNGHEDFSLESIYEGYPTVTQNLGTGSIRYVDNQSDSPVFHQKHACQ